MSAGAASPPINASCPRCGRIFSCRPEGPCWCGSEGVKLPRAALDPDLACYCADCLPLVAAERLGKRGR